MKKCPYCAEEIQDEAIKCRFCNEFLTTPSGPVVTSSRQTSLPWYFRTSIIVIALLTVGPLALPMVWWHPVMKPPVKIGVTLGIIALTWFLCWSTFAMFRYIEDSMKSLGIS